MVLFDKGDKILKSVDFQKSPEEWIRQLRTASDVPDRADAAFALGSVRDNESAANALGEAAQEDKFWGVREESLRALGRMNSLPARKQVLAALSNEQPWVRAIAVEQLGRYRRDEEIAKRLQSIYKDDKAYPCAVRRCRPWRRIRLPMPPILEKALAVSSPDDVCAARRCAPWVRSETIPWFPRSSNGLRPETVRAAQCGHRIARDGRT